MPKRYWVELTEAELGVLRTHFATMVEANEIYAQDPSLQGQRQQTVGARAVAALDRARAAGPRMMVQMTQLEARALDIAQDNSTCDPEFIRDFLQGPLKAACGRAVRRSKAVAYDGYNASVAGRKGRA